MAYCFGGNLFIALYLFKYVYLVSSYQDTYIPFYSERVELTPQIEASTKEEAVVIREMIDLFWKDLKQPGCTTKIRKWDVDFDVYMR